MKVIKVGFVCLTLSALVVVSSVLWFIFSKSTEELFGHYVSTKYNVLVPDNVLVFYFKTSELDTLKQKSMLDSRPLPANLINISDAVPVDKKKFQYLLSIVLDKYHGDNFFSGEVCGFLDQLIMKGDVDLIYFLVDNGYSSSEINKKVCKKDFLALAEKYRFKYEMAEYSRLIELINLKF